MKRKILIGGAVYLALGALVTVVARAKGKVNRPAQYAFVPLIWPYVAFELVRDRGIVGGYARHTETSELLGDVMHTNPAQGYRPVLNDRGLPA